MKNLANESTENCDIAIKTELEAAGIRVVKVPRERSEVPYTLIGKIGAWTLRRAWVYWIASVDRGEGIPKREAEELNRRFRDVVRIMGSAGGDDVYKHLERGHINHYSIDTQPGLNAFAMLVAVLM